MLIKLELSDTLVVSVADAKIRLRIESETEEDDADIEKMIRAATATVEHATGRVLLPTEFEYRFEGWQSDFCIPVVPLRGVSDLLYLDGVNAEQSVDAANWYDEWDDRGFMVHLDASFNRPPLSTRTNPVRVRFSAGFDEPEDSTEVPALRPDPRDQAMVLFLVGHWYANREAASEMKLSEVPSGFEALAAQRKIYR